MRLAAGRGELSLAVGLLLAALLVACGDGRAEQPALEPALASPDAAAAPLGWEPADIETLRGLWLGSLPDLPPDPSNAYGDDPEAAALGQRIFFDPRFSANGQVSCATCHQPGLFFTDGLPRAQAIGQTERGTPTIAGMAYSPWFFWDGRRDSQWAQALTPMESPVEHGGTRTQYAHLIDQDPSYRAAYEAIFGPLPDLSDPSRFPDSAGPVENAAAAAAWSAMQPEDRVIVNRVYANIGKAVAAYERQIMPGPSRFDIYVEALLQGDESGMAEALSPDEAAGLRLFLGKGTCIRCHNGPLFTNHGFHNIGVPTAEGQELDVGRITGVQQALDDEFNCLGEYSDAGPDECAELRFAKTFGLELPGAFKVPTLRNVAETGPYMHAGQFATLAEVLAHYNQGQPGPIGHSELQPLGLTSQEMGQLEAFLAALSGPLGASPELLRPPEGE